MPSDIEIMNRKKDERLHTSVRANHDLDGYRVAMCHRFVDGTGTAGASHATRLTARMYKGDADELRAQQSGNHTYIERFNR